MDLILISRLISIQVLIPRFVIRTEEELIQFFILFYYYDPTCELPVINDSILPRLSNHLWILSPTDNPCRGLSPVLIEIVQEYYYYHPLHIPIYQQAYQLAIQSLFPALTDGNSNRTASTIDIMNTASNVAEAKLVMTTLLFYRNTPTNNNNNNTTPMELTLSLLKHPNYDVRLITLKLLKQYLQQYPNSEQQQQGLWLTPNQLYGLLFQENHFLCLKRLLQLLITKETSSTSGITNSAGIGENDEDKIRMLDKLWDKLVQLLPSPAKTQVIPFMGSCFRQVPFLSYILYLYVLPLSQLTFYILSCCL